MPIPPFIPDSQQKIVATEGTTNYNFVPGALSGTDQAVAKANAETKILATDTGATGNPIVESKQVKKGSLNDSFKVLNDSFTVGSYTYPIDLISNQETYGHNYVVFYISVSKGSSALKKDDSAIVPDINRLYDRSAISQNGITKLEGEGSMAVQTLFTGGTIGALASLLPGSSASRAIRAGGTAGVTVAVKTLGAIGLVANTTNDVFQNPQVTLKSAIALYMPNELHVSYATQWGEEDTALFQAGTMGIEAIRNLDKGAIQQGGLVGDAFGALGAHTYKSAALSMGLQYNPKKEQQFQSVHFRDFSFTYQFAPRSEEETKSVQNIIKTFKYHMHPEFKNATGFLWMYPSEWNIVFYNNGTENKNIHKHTSCVLVDMKINYTPNGQFTSYKEGMPTQINIELHFRELQQITKELVDAGA